MARQIKATPTVIVGANIINYMVNKTVSATAIAVDDTVTNFKYIGEDDTVKKITGRVSEIKYSGWRNGAIADRMSSKGSFKDASVITGFVIDKSTEKHSDITFIKAEDVLDYGAEGDVASVEIVGTLAVKLNITLSDETSSTITISEKGVLKGATLILNGNEETGNFLVKEFLYITKPSGEIDVRGFILKDMNGTDYIVSFANVLKTGTVGVISDMVDGDEDEGPIYILCESTDTGALEVVSDNAEDFNAETQIRFSDVNGEVEGVTVGLYVKRVATVTGSGQNGTGFDPGL